MFRERGFAETGMRDIAGAADLSAANLYHYFAGKNEILLKTVQNDQKEQWAQVWQFGLRICDATGGPLPVKIAITVMLIAPVGFLMGMPFPTGLTRLEEHQQTSVRWAWSLNAASSVMGSAGAVV